MSHSFVPHHISATAADLEGNGGRGRYILLPGSDGRAEAIAEAFDALRVVPSPRRHSLYLGSVQSPSGRVDVAAVATGMGCPSVDIIVTELFKLGARVFLRVGTAGSLQPERVAVGDLVVATAAVRDEATSNAYLPPEVPAVASGEMLEAARRAARGYASSHIEGLHFGVVHTKDSLFARELGEGPRAAENERYMETLVSAGVLASEMEAAHLFVLASIFGQQLAALNGHGQSSVLAGAVLGVIGGREPFAEEARAQATIERAVSFALDTVRALAEIER